MDATVSPRRKSSETSLGETPDDADTPEDDGTEEDACDEPVDDGTEEDASDNEPGVVVFCMIQ